MKTKSWIPWMIAVAVNAGFVWMAFSRPWAEGDLASADFVAADGPFSISTQLDLTTVQPARCEIHKVRMNEEVVPVYCALPVRGDDSRGLDAWSDPPEELRATLFPHGERYVMGAFAVGDERDARIHVCPECRRAEEQWRGAKGVARRSVR